MGGDVICGASRSGSKTSYLSDRESIICCFPFLLPCGLDVAESSKNRDTLFLLELSELPEVPDLSSFLRPALSICMNHGKYTGHEK